MSEEPNVGATRLSFFRGMPRRGTATLLVLSIFVFGCGTYVETHRVDPEVAARLGDEIKLYQPAEPRSLKFTPVRALETLSCKNNFWDPDPTQEDALAQMRLKASLLGANGIMDLYCSKHGTSSYCWSSISCAGTAIKVDAQ